MDIPGRRLQYLISNLFNIIIISSILVHPFVSPFRGVLSSMSQVYALALYVIAFRSSRVGPASIRPASARARVSARDKRMRSRRASGRAVRGEVEGREDARVADKNDDALTRECRSRMRSIAVGRRALR